MSKACALVVALCAIALLASPIALAQNAAPSPPPATDAAPPYVLTMGDMMNTFVQPRHAKLGLAGRAGNWVLAAYALAEIRETFTGIAKAKPRFRGMPVGELADAALKAPLAAVESAIKQRDLERFATAYAQLTDGCNACHATLDHPFVVIKVPDTSAFPNQDFNFHQ
jgi:hypothetical protein